MRRILLRHFGVLVVIFQATTLVAGEKAAGEKTTGEKTVSQEAEADTADAKGIALFEQQIKPALVKYCYECHSKDADEIEGGLELDSPSGMMGGGDSGPMLSSHDVGASPLIPMLRHDEDVSGMPPEEPIPDELVSAFEEWIRLGAPDSREDTGPTVRAQRDEIGRRHWAFQPPQSVEPPEVVRSDWPRSAIDSFVLARMEAEGLTPVADANRRTLIRRVYFDLIGLPPSAEEVQQFMADESPDAMAELIDRLLDSPRFGERWGRHWLDVVRYAESSGMEFNFTYPHAWPYRDYVIDALNQDKPYDVFLREQIAGDLLPGRANETPAEMEARNIAPSMLAFGPKRHNSGGAEYQMDVADDQIDTVCRSMLAMTVACARCHDHKFDPIPTKDYYALAGIFLSTEPLYGTIKQKYSNNPTDLLPIGPNAKVLHAAAEQYEKKIGEVDEQLTAKRKELETAIEAEKQATEKKALAAKQLAETVAQLAGSSTDGSTGDGQTTGTTSEPVSQEKSNEKESVKADVSDQDALSRATDELTRSTEAVAKVKAEITQFEATLEDLKKDRPPRPHYAMSARDREKPADTKVAIRGNFRERGDTVPRGFLGAVHVENSLAINPSHSGRLELARWIASSGNPLTARVMVNRIWQHLFGRGLVATVDNFGLIGKLPSHPQLLDALALRFVREEWSVKRMIRTIVLSRTYQLSNARDEKNRTIDPENQFLWHAVPRRLEAESIRDAMLAVSGQLDLDRPDGSTVTSLGDQLVRGIATEKIQPPSNHRSIYLPVVRDYVPELFDLFDFPSPSLVSGRRSVTNVPSQALYLRNSSFAAEQAEHAAKRLLAQEGVTNDVARVDVSMMWALARPATEAERIGALQLVQQVRQSETENDAESDVDSSVKSNVNVWAAWFRTLFTTAEFRYLVDAK